MNINDLISVIIPCFNGEKYINEAIESVICQKDVCFEIIIVDDGSTDNTSKIIKQYTEKNIKLLYQANHGQGYAFNNAIGVSNGNYIAFLDHDDLFTPNKLSLQINYMKDNPDTHLVFGMIEHFISPELPDHIKTIRHCPSEPLPGIAPSTMMFKRECFDILGPFNTTLKVGSHIDWLIRAKEKGFNQYTLPQVVSRRRIHDTNTSIIERHNHGQYIQIIKEKLARERLRNAHNEVYHEK